MTINWHVGVAEHRRDELAEHELIAQGFQVHIPRRWQRERTAAGKMKTTYDLTHAPYFYVRFDGEAPEEYSLALRQRGVAHVLETKPGKPGPIPECVILDHRSRERGERANLQPHRVRGRSDLVLQAEYEILAGPLKGKFGKLFEFSRGTAYLACGMMKVEVPDNDILIVKSQKAKAGAA